MADTTCVKYPLFDRPRPAVQARDPGVLDEDRPRLSEQCLAIADKLRRGPATNLELGDHAQRFGARLHDLKRAGFLWKRTPLGQGVNQYAMIRDFLPEPPR